MNQTYKNVCLYAGVVLQYTYQINIFFGAWRKSTPIVKAYERKHTFAPSG